MLIQRGGFPALVSRETVLLVDKRSFFESLPRQVCTPSRSETPFVIVIGGRTGGAWFNQFVEFLEEKEVFHLFILRVGADAGNLLALELDPALTVLTLDVDRLHLDHLFKTDDDLRCVPPRDLLFEPTRAKR